MSVPVPAEGARTFVSIPVQHRQVVKMLTDFHSPIKGGGAWEANKEIKDWEWWLARTDDGGWTLITYGY